MKFKLSIAIISALFVFAACNNSNEQSEENKETTEQISEHDKHSSNEHKEDSEKKIDLKLNGDEKWEANQATGIGMTKIKDVLSAINTDGMTVEQYRELGGKLSEQTDYIINKCDMSGPAHDNLHIVLTEILTKISELKEVNSPDEGKTYVNNLSKDIKTYFEYFKSV